MASVRLALQHFAHELGRRRVWRVLVAYVIAVFGALQGLDIMVTRLELPGVWMRWAVLLALAGLPVAAVLSWVFDWTREGLVRTPPAPKGNASCCRWLRRCEVAPGGHRVDDTRPCTAARAHGPAEGRFGGINSAAMPRRRSRARRSQRRRH